MASTLQALFFLPSFRDAILSLDMSGGRSRARSVAQDAGRSEEDRQVARRWLRASDFVGELRCVFGNLAASSCRFHTPKRFLEAFAR